MTHIVSDFFTTEKEKLTKNHGKLYKKFNFLNYIRNVNKFFIFEFSYHFENRIINRTEFEYLCNIKKLAKVEEKLEKLTLLSEEEEKQLIFEKISTKWKVEHLEYLLKYGEKSKNFLVQQY